MIRTRVTTSRVFPGGVRFAPCCLSAAAWTQPLSLFSEEETRMKKTLSAMGLAIAFAVTAGAQSTPPSQTQPPDQPQTKSAMGSKDKAKSLTLSGCLREGDEPNTYVLANVDMSKMSDTASSSSPAGSTAAPSSQAGTSGSSMDNTVKLVGSTNLKDHVGHQIEVTGTMAKKDKAKSKATGTTGSAAGETASDTTSRAGERGASGDKNMHTLNVRSVKMVAASCTSN
jgi:hypothetical protein